MIQNSVPKHPEYVKNASKNKKFRLLWESGTKFIKTYTRQFSPAESALDYLNRVSISYNPSFAKQAVLDVKNAISHRANDIVREGGSKSYKDAMTFDVDIKLSPMNTFIGNVVLPELLAMGKVGVYVDTPKLEDLDIATSRPYLYTYKTEDIVNWHFYKPNRLDAALLRSSEEVLDSMGLVTESEDEYLYLKRISSGQVVVETGDFKSDTGGPRNASQLIWVSSSSLTLEIPEIPFIIFELSGSLLEDVADYQIALLNLASADMNYALRSNFPFYTEQIDAVAAYGQIREKLPNSTDKVKSEKVGSVHGRTYPIGAERPGFIHPSAEPLRVSMEKQAQLKEEIRTLVNLAVSETRPKTRPSGEGGEKRWDKTGLESGLNYIALELERGEYRIAEIWHELEHKTLDAIDRVLISYPSKYSIKTDTERYAEAQQLIEFLPKVPSKAYQKKIAEAVAATTVGFRNTDKELKIINNEINEAISVINDPAVIFESVERGILSSETAAIILGYPADEVEKAKAEHLERVARIAEAQSSNKNENKDTSDSLERRQEKEATQEGDTNPEQPTSKKKVRGES